MGLWKQIYSGDPNNKLVWYLNDPNLSNPWMVCCLGHGLNNELNISNSDVHYCKVKMNLTSTPSGTLSKWFNEFTFKSFIMIAKWYWIICLSYKWIVKYFVNLTIWLPNHDQMILCLLDCCCIIPLPNTRPTVWIPNQYMQKLDGIHLPGIQMAFKYRTIWNPTSGPFGIQPLFDHLNTQLVRYSDPHCIHFELLNIKV